MKVIEGTLIVEVENFIELLNFVSEFTNSREIDIKKLDGNKWEVKIK